MPSPRDAYSKLLEELDCQYLDGERRQNDEGSIWGGTGGDVKRALSYATEAISEPRDCEDLDTYLTRIRAQLLEKRAEYKSLEADRDGYGNATFNEILRHTRTQKSQSPTMPKNKTTQHTKEQYDIKSFYYAVLLLLLTFIVFFIDYKY